MLCKCPPAKQNRPYFQRKEFALLKMDRRRSPTTKRNTTPTRQGKDHLLAPPTRLPWSQIRTGPPLPIRSWTHPHHANRWQYRSRTWVPASHLALSHRHAHRIRRRIIGTHTRRHLRHARQHLHPHTHSSAHAASNCRQCHTVAGTSGRHTPRCTFSTCSQGACAATSAAAPAVVARCRWLRRDGGWPAGVARGGGGLRL